MLAFFRRIRKALLESGAISKYLLYAIGEVLLVMVGILLALQVNNWNQNRTNKGKEQLLMKEIHAEFLINRRELTGTLQHYSGVNEKFSSIIESIEQGNYHIDSLDSLFRGTYGLQDADLTAGSISALVNSGSLEIISNSELRTLLIQWKDLVADYKSLESMVLKFTVEQYFPYMDSKMWADYEGIKHHSIDLLFLNTTKFLNMIKRRRAYIQMMLGRVRNDDGKLMKSIDRIIELSASKAGN